MRGMDEIFLIDKPKGMSSFGVVARVRRVLTEKMKECGRASEVGKEERTGEGVKGGDFGVVKKQGRKRVKVGHAGTLDPFATGLLIVLVGKATKRSGEFLKLNKEYVAVVWLGEKSTTGDPEGEITESFRVLGEGERDEMGLGENEENVGNVGEGFCKEKVKRGKAPTREEVERAVRSFLGEVEQRVPAFSAVKIKGRRAYELARKGVEVEMPVRKVKIYDIEVAEYEWPKLVVRAEVSSGTYMRTLGEDIGEKLGVGAYLTELRRTKIDKYSVEEAKGLEEFLREVEAKKR